MYLIKKDVKLELVSDNHQRDIANKVGVTEYTLSKILNRKQACSKKLAYAIVKVNNSDSEILDYFEIAEKGITAVGISCKAKSMLKELADKLGQDMNKTLEELLIERLGG